MIILRNALNAAANFTGMPAAYAIWETDEDFLFFMVPEDTPTNQCLNMGATLTAVSKGTGKAYFYDIFDHGEEFSKAKCIDFVRKG